MKNILCILLLTGALAAQAQMPANDLLRHIPADADQVVDVNLGLITSKIDLPALMNIVSSKAKNNKSIAKIPQFLNSGLDLHQSLIIAGINTNKPDSIKYQVFVFNLTDSGKFAAALRNLAKDGTEPVHILHPSGKQRVAVRGHDAFAWTDKLAVLVMGTPAKQAASTQQPVSVLQAKVARRCAMTLAGYANTKFITDEHFATTFSNGGDVHIWSLHGQWAAMMNKAMSKMPSDKMGQLGALSQLMNSGKAQGQSIATLRFDNGSIKYTTLKFMQPNELAAAKLIMGQGLNPEVAGLVPPRQVLGVATIHWDMQALLDTLKKSPMFPMMDTMLHSKGISAIDVFNTFKGDFMLLACSPDKTIPDTSTEKKKMPTPTLYLVASINSKAAFDKIIPVLKLRDVSTLTTEPVITDSTGHNKNPFQYYSVQNGFVVLGKFSQAREFFTKGSNTDPAGKLLPDQANANVVNLGIDIHALLTNVFASMINPGGSQDGGNQKLMETLGQFQTLQIAAGAIRGDAMESKVELRLADQNKNSLTNLIDMINTLSGKPAGGAPGQ